MIKIFDGHADIWNDIYEKTLNNENKIFERYHYERFKSGGVNGGIFVIWLPEKNSEGEIIQKEDLLHLFNKMLDSVEKENASFGERFKIVKTIEDLDRFFKDDKMYIVKGIEGLKVIENEKSLEIIDRLYKLGYRVCSLAWNEENALATGTKGRVERGVTELGEKCILKMNILGMVIDVSHLNEKSFWDVVKISKKPIIASHSASYKLCNHVRNLTDEQIRAVAKTGGVVGVNAFRNFLDDDDELRNLEKYIEHIEHIISVAGIKAVGLGFDFCEYLPSNSGDENLLGLKNASESQNIINILREKGFLENEIELIAYKNFERVFRNNFK